MADVGVDLGPPSDLERLAHGLEEQLALGSHVRVVDPVEGDQGGRHGGHLVGCGVHVGHVDEAGGEADRAGLQRFGEQPAHGADLRLRRGAAFVAHHLGAQTPEPGQRGDVAGGPRDVDGVEVLGGGVPAATELLDAGTRDVARSARFALGHAEAPQLPATTVVTPCRRALSIHGSVKGARSEWVWTSMKPGARARPAASIVRTAAGRPPSAPWSGTPRRRTRATRPPVTPTSAA